jgi:predicted ATPase
MLKQILFKKDYRTFKKDDCISFKKGINLLVGENGCGKSTLIDLITKYNKEIIDLKYDLGDSYRVFDFEKDIPRNKNEFISETKLQLALSFCSHGEAIKSIFKPLKDNIKENIIIMDEPDISLSIKSCKELVNKFNQLDKEKYQIIASIHNPIIISSFEFVLNVEKKEWEKSNDFIEQQLEGA